MAHSSFTPPHGNEHFSRASVEVKFDRQLLHELVKQVLSEAGELLDWPAGRIALPEDEAAQACGVGRHVLRDLRLSGVIKAHRLGRKVVYTRADLIAALHSSAPTAGGGEQCHLQ